MPDSKQIIVALDAPDASSTLRMLDALDPARIETRNSRW